MQKFCPHCGHRLVSEEENKWELWSIDAWPDECPEGYNWVWNDKSRTGETYSIDDSFWKMSERQQLNYLKKLGVIDTTNGVVLDVQDEMIEIQDKKDDYRPVMALIYDRWA